AGLAMATMDIAKAGGHDPANFLDVGGGAGPERVAEAMTIILEDPQVSRVLVNVFGGIARCDDIARGIVLAIPDDRRGIPIIVRFLGTATEEGKQILRESGLNTYFIDGLSEATEVLKGLASS
ncbi:MAG: succinate--CoA ligase subunit beta, partial [Dehalococcoidia bacterium]